MPKPREKPPNNAATRVVSGEAFRRWRDANGLSYGDLAPLLGVTRTAVQKLDKTGLTQTQALAIQAILHKLKPWNPDEEEA